MSYSRLVGSTTIASLAAESVRLTDTSARLSTLNDRLRAWKRFGENRMHARWIANDVEIARTEVHTEADDRIKVLRDGMNEVKRRSNTTILIQTPMVIVQDGEVRQICFIGTVPEMVVRTKITEHGLELIVAPKKEIDGLERDLVPNRRANRLALTAYIIGGLVIAINGFVPVVGLLLFYVLSVSAIINYELQKTHAKWIDTTSAEQTIARFEEAKRIILEELGGIEKIIGQILKN